MIQHILFSLVFLVLFYFSLNVNLEFVPSIRETWVWNKEGRFGTPIPKKGENPIQTLNGYKVNGKYFSFANNRYPDIDTKYLVEFPLLSKGYLEYEKIGDEVNYYSERGELFWKKPINSYPRSGLFASPILYLSGDNNTVFLMDESGNGVGKGEINGRFLTDYQFDPNNKGAVILFSGGEIYRLDEKGNELYFLDLSKDIKNSFFKSLAMSPNGKLVSIHYSLQDKDFILILDEKGEIILTKEFPGFYPHKIYFATSNSGSILFNLPDKLIYFDGDDFLWTKEKNKIGNVFQTVFSAQGLFAVLNESDLVFYNERGEQMRTKRMSQLELPIRMFASKSENMFYLESKNDLFQFQIF
ncbi:hypothetical protein P3G55_05020 [Leptospira sp. 96542]|nr:hypothetical protein [Leptospira sp. 96542]